MRDLIRDYVYCVKLDKTLISYDTTIHQGNVTESSLVALTLLQSFQVQSPEASLARLVLGPWHLDKALVERQVVPDGVLQQRIPTQSRVQCFQQPTVASNIKQEHSQCSCGVIDYFI